MENSLSLFSTEVDITDKLKIRVPTVGEVLSNEDVYFSLVSILTASPFQYMVPLDDIGVDYSSISDFEMFMIFFPSYAQSGTEILFGELDLRDLIPCVNNKNGAPVLYSKKNDLMIDELVYNTMSTVIRKMNHLKKDRRKPGNEAAKEYLLERERKRIQRQERKRKRMDYDESEFERLVIALVNENKFKYDYTSVRDLSIYNFYQSFKQIQQKINYENVMRGVYAGTIDTSKMTDKSCLSWIPIK